MTAAVAKPTASLLNLRDVAVLCVAWAFIWSMCHNVCWSCWTGRPLGLLICGKPSKREKYLRRTCRSQIYCSIAVVGAIGLLARLWCASEDFIYDCFMGHQVLFAMAVGHSFVTFYEDWSSPSILVNGLDASSLRGIKDPATFLLRACMVHHVAIILGFVGLLWSQRCASVGSFGLLSELPVLMMNRRELALHSFPAPEWLRSRRAVQRHWRTAVVFVLIGRLCPICVYIYSLAQWLGPLGKLELVAKCTYHGLAIFFIAQNYFFGSVFNDWYRRDMAAVRDTGGQCESSEREDGEQVVRQNAAPVVDIQATEYMIFDHTRELLGTVRVIAVFGLGFGANALALKVSALDSDSGMGMGARLLDAFFVGLLSAASSGIFALLCSLVIKAVPISWSWRDHSIALCILVYFAGFAAACQSSIKLEFAAISMLSLEAHLQGPSWHGWRGLGAVAATWFARVTLALWHSTPDELSRDFRFSIAWRLLAVLGRHTPCALAIAAFAGATRLLTHQFGDSSRRGRSELIAIFVRSTKLAGLYATLVCVALVKWTDGSVTGQRLEELLATPAHFLASAVVVAISLGVLANLLHTAHIFSSAFASRAVAFTLVMVAALEGGFREYRWATHLAFAVHLGALGAGNRVRLHEAGEEGRFCDLRFHIVGQQAIWDQLRLMLALLVWRSIVIPMQHILSFLLPEEMSMYACDIPIFNLGENVAMGMCAHFAPKRNDQGSVRLQKTPEYFVCNVGHISNEDSRGLEDMQRTMNALRDVWQEFDMSDIKGLISNMVAVFPLMGGTGMTKEINLSAWESAQDAHDWYIDSPGHRLTVFQHTSGYLRCFGNLLASLRPTGPLRHQDRCQRCARSVESPEPGTRAPTRCGVCGGSTFQYPLF